MRKAVKILSLILAFALTVAIAPTPARAGGARILESGVTGMKKLTRAEIAAIFAAETEPAKNELMDRQPDLEAPYEDAGQISASHRAAALTRLNDLRRLAGLPAVEADLNYGELAQAGAYADALYGQLSHFPAQAQGLGDTLYALGAEGTSRSNIAWASWESDLLHSVDLWANDTDASNIERLGHRRWVLNPTMGKTGFGYCYKPVNGTYTAMYAFDRSGEDCDYEFIGWPASGYFPAGEDFFESTSAWSVTLNLDKYLKPGADEVKVTLRRESDGTTWEFSGSGWEPSESGEYFNVELSGYGVENAIIFRPTGIEEYDGRYTVTVSGVRDKSGAPADFSYSVEFFDLQDTIDYYTPPEFEDVTQEWQREAVKFVYSHGRVMQGTSNKYFDPAGVVDLGTALTVMARLSGVDTTVTDGDWSRPGMTWGREQGLTNNANHAARISRQELVYMLWVVAQCPDADPGFLEGWSDAELVRQEYRQAQAWAVYCGILKGSGDNKLNPDGVLTRAELAAFVMRAFEGGYLG